MAPSSTIVFDGVCVLCSGTVLFILRRDRRRIFKFSAAQSPPGSALLRAHGFEPARLETFVLFRDGHVLVRSDAALAIVRELGWPWRALGVFRVVPRRVRDAIYDFIAARRYRWFGTRDACFVPTEEMRSRFVE